MTRRFLRSIPAIASVAVLSVMACAKSASVDSTAPGASVPPPPTAAAPVVAVVSQPKSDVFTTSQGDLKVTPMHHATMLLEWQGKHIYADPFHEANFDGFPKADVIFITDIHPDHLDPAALDLVKQPSTIVVAPPKVAEKLPKGFAQVVVLKNGDKQTVAGIGVEAIPMYNLTRGPSAGTLFHDKGRGDGYVLTFGDKRAYLSGDTECTPEMRALKDIDVAFVCMNLPYTMPPTEAAACVKAFRPKVVFPYHYRGSNLSEFSEPLKAERDIEVRERNWY